MAEGAEGGCWRYIGPVMSVVHSASEGTEVETTIPSPAFDDGELVWRLRRDLTVTDDEVTTDGHEEVTLRCRAGEPMRCVCYFSQASHVRSPHAGGESDEDWAYAVREGPDGALEVERTGDFEFAADPPLPETVDALYASEALRVSETTPPL